MHVVEHRLADKLAFVLEPEQARGLMIGVAERQIAVDENGVGGGLDDLLELLLALFERPQGVEILAGIMNDRIQKLAAFVLDQATVDLDVANGAVGNPVAKQERVAASLTCLVQAAADFGLLEQIDLGDAHAAQRLP